MFFDSFQRKCIKSIRVLLVFFCVIDSVASALDLEKR